MSYPRTYDELQARQDTLQDLITTYGDDPKKCAALNQGSVRVDIPAMIQSWKEELAVLQQRVADFPHMVHTDAI